MNDNCRIFTVLAGRKIRELCLGVPFLILLIIQQLVFFFMQRDALLALERDGMLVAFHPAQYGLLISAFFLGIFLALYVAIEPARDRESGALETLFYGPVSAGMYLAALFVVMLAALLISGINLLGALGMGCIFIGYEIPASLVPLLPVMIFCFCGMGITGMFVSVLFRQPRTGMIIVAVLLVVSLGLTVGNFWFSQNDISGSFAMIFLRRALSGLNRIMAFIFPLGLFFEDILWFVGYGRIPPFHIFWYLIYDMVLFAGAVVTLGKRGVLAR
jgi:ABC-type transport system involved in multi-copper enzyme maturation permease subunit